MTGMTQTLTTVDYASPTTPKTSPRLLSLDVFRGLVILAMLVVNNIGDGATTGYFWKHAGWTRQWSEVWSGWRLAVTGMEIHHDYRPELQEVQDQLAAVQSQIQSQMVDERPGPTVRPSPTPMGERSFATPNATDLMLIHFFELVDRRESLEKLQERAEFIPASPWSRVPLFTNCTLADYVMPWFMLIIGVAIPFSVAASIASGVSEEQMWMRTFRRAATLVALGWILCYFRDQFEKSLYEGAPWTVSLGLDVLQLLGISYLVARICYECSAFQRAAIAAIFFVGHWALLRFYTDGSFPRGTFLEDRDAFEQIYQKWNPLTLGFATINFRGILSVPPGAATMVIGTLIGDWLRRDVSSKRKIFALIVGGFAMSILGFAWAFDLPFNKPRWTPSYLSWTSGVGTILIAILYWIIDVKNIRRWTYPLVVFGTNAIALYFCSIMAKVLLLNTPRVNGRPLIDVVLESLKRPLGPWAGGWAFTIGFVAVWWVILDQMYRRKIFWKV
jgi:predicted acyltransferase